MNNKQQHFAITVVSMDMYLVNVNTQKSLGFIVYRIRDNNILEYLLIRRKIH